MKLRLALAAATCFALPIVAHAQPVTGPYVSLGAGTSLQNSVNYRTPTDNGKVVSRASYAGDAAVGYGFGDGFRVQLSGDFNRNTLHKLDSNMYNQSRVSGQFMTYGPMVDVLYDMNVGLPIYPYVGVGAGYQWRHFRSSNGMADSTEGSFAYNIIGGVSYPLAVVPGLSLTAEYKFMQLTASRNYGTTNIGQSSSHTFLLGLRYQLFQPAQAPAPAPAPVVAAPAPVPAKTFLVFFDWDKYNLTPRATQIIAQAAVYSKSSSVTTLDVNGYTDTSGAAGYNMGLSIRRAKAVAAQLVVDGVPANEIEINGFGETHLLVPTGPGVREPQNRRVEIILH